MTEKESKLIVEVDLECSRCEKKIKKVLSKLQESMTFQSTFDDKKNSITITGSFDPDCLCEKLRCMAGCVIICIKIIIIITPPPPPTEHVCCRTPWPNCCCNPCPCFSPSHGCRRCCSCSWTCCVPPMPPACPSGDVCRPTPTPCPPWVCTPTPCPPPSSPYCYLGHCEDASPANACSTM